uniref:ANK_REP_REGION domain-containing protein n=1 Tax=Angiostrongylus cantonensis TaxID=6313 RepID=A0A0K0DCA4_ANGCA
MLEEAVSYIPSAQEWQTKMRIENRHEGPRDAVASLSVTELMLKGARIADIMCSLLRIVLNCHMGTVQISKAKAYTMFTIIENIKSILNRKRTVIQTDVYLFFIIESRARLCICGVALEIAQYKEAMGRLNSSQLDALISRLETFCKMDAIIESPLKEHCITLAIIIVVLHVSSCQYLSPLQHFTMAVSDCIRYVEKSKKRNHSGRFCEEAVESIKKGFLYPLCAVIEVDLRVLSHQHLVVDERDKPSQEILDFCKKMMFDPDIRLHGTLLSTRGRIFYELTAVTLHDRHAYAKMSMLAKQRKKEKKMRDFVQYYMMVLSSVILLAFFIEKTSPNRTLRMLTVDHMADSMRTHGLGVLNTGVNLTYQLLRNKFTVFNQFLKDEHIHAQLQKDIRYFHENMESLNKMMGNALGFVRSMSSAAVAVASQMKNYDTVVEDIGLPDPNDDSPIRTTKELLRELREHASKTRSFVKMLIDVFRSAFLDESRFSHLLDFYVAVPALTMNYVEHMLMCRDRLKKRVQHDKELTFTDDGFTMGMFSFLKCAADKEMLNEEMKTSKDSRSASLRATRLQAYERVASCGYFQIYHILQKLVGLYSFGKLLYEVTEFKLLSFTLQSSRVFFSVDDDED